MSLFSCEDFFSTTLDIDPPTSEDLLAVHAFGSTRTNELEVLVGRTLSVDKVADNTSFVNDAVVKLYLGEDLIHELESIPEPSINTRFNFYMPDDIHVFEKGSEYRIEVEAQGYPLATAVCQIPNDINPTAVIFEEDAGTDFDGYEYSGINIKFNDPSGEENFYEMTALYGYPDGSGELRFDHRYTEFIDASIQYGIDNLIANDNTFDGDEKTFELQIGRISPEFEPDELEKLYLNWRITTEAHFLFNKTVNALYQNEDDPFSSPVQVYSNIENGVGLFSIVNETFLKVD